MSVMDSLKSTFHGHWACPLLQNVNIDLSPLHYITCTYLALNLLSSTESRDI